MPIVEAVERYETTPLPERLAERRLGVDLLGPGVDGRKADHDGFLAQ
jgi:hypothetical protein